MQPTHLGGKRPFSKTQPISHRGDFLSRTGTSFAHSRKKGSFMNNATTSENIAETTASRLQQKSRALLEDTKQACAATDRYVHENPWASLGVAAAVGMLIGFLVGQRRS
jgi:ElaB/YqjD/DUF883 family membrane-anchored ribosome-binding protein